MSYEKLSPGCESDEYSAGSVVFAAVDADLLGGNPHPGEAVADQFVVGHRPVRAVVRSAAHIEPLDHDRPVEPLRVDRTVDGYPRLVRRADASRDLPLAVARQGLHGHIGVGGAREEELGLLVADL